MLFAVLYGFIEITELVISQAEIVVGTSLVCPVSQFFNNAEMLFVVLYGLIEITQLEISHAKKVVGKSLVFAVSQFFCIV